MKEHFVVNFYFKVDLMWSDPDDIDTWIVSNRGAGWIFGWKVVNEVISFVKFLVQSFK